jgi:hypothetical protein
MRRVSPEMRYIWNNNPVLAIELWLARLWQWAKP